MKIAESKLYQWEQFSEYMKAHMETYTIPQYGDFPSKTVGRWSKEKIQAKLEAYVDRICSGQRGRDSQIIDALKIADFGRYLFAVLTTGSAQGDLSEPLEDMKYLKSKQDETS